MQQQQQQPGGGPHQFGAPPSEMTAFPSSSGAVHLHTPKPSQQAEAASPINSRPPPPPPAANFDELGSSVAGGFPDEEALAAGDEAERGGPAGNRWPRQETLALLKIRSEMDAAFRDATFKGPLWEEVSRKLAELGYKRSAKKCKEKFENVHKYYKRTKEGRAGRQDGKAYRFFTELEALHNTGAGVSAPTPTATAAPPLAAASPTTFTFTTPMAGPPTARIQPLPISAVAPPLVTPSTRVVPDLSPPVISTSVPAAAAAAAAGISFSFDSSASSSSESEEVDEMEEAGGSRGGRKRKRAGGGSRYPRRMMTFFEGLMKQVMERQEAMQQRFLEAIEKREQDRMKREEAWRLQEMARLSREQELLAHERAMAASRDTAVISYLQKISGQPILFPTIPATAAPTTVATPLSSQPSQPPSAAPTPQPVNLTPPLQPSVSSQQKHETPRHNQVAQDDRPQPSPAAMQLAPISIEPPEGLGSGGFELASSSRWPKAEVHALIKLRSGLESKYQEAGPKGPLWEEIAAGMQRMGYNRSSKRCKEKWENINKYFKKVKESNRKRPQDSKTCPYFHQLDALYRKKQQHGGGVGSSSSGAGAQHQQDASQEQPQVQPPPDSQGKNGNKNGGNSDGGGGSNGSNGGHTQSYLEGMEKPEDIVKELMARQQQQQQQQQHQGVMDDYDKMDEADSVNLDQDDEDDDDEDDEDSKMQYKIQFQRQNVSNSGGGGSATSAAATQAGSFLAMVQ